MPNGLVAVTTISSMDFLCLFAQPALVSPDHQGQVVLILQNCGNEDITIPRFNHWMH
jgi:dUTPase